MPILTRTFIKTALTYFVLALAVGLLLALRPLVSLPVWAAGLTPVYFHLFMVGWVTELIIGVAYWMFPKFSRESPRGWEGLAWAVYGLLNFGLLARIIAEPAQAAGGGAWTGGLLAASALAQWLAGLLFVANTWPRVKVK
ncbi:MAG: hypothetical protein KBG20_12605 [Caldilineaceae bacterium]|nr:hypothetical protein [Caldilineaceae bacterium]MBP8109544.1 hypothetical protein [Caldilineaceae bacterium]MBP8121896.1 hypothetical protein [Caldilineaceae bacterium]MBP9073139.1 hypothetical protein [Caldilineaceae bacterium]